ncbi:hypothetical protein AAMO2058_001555500 [Amorphochlora amoebiformis]
MYEMLLGYVKIDVLGELLAARDHDGRTPLHYCAINGGEELVSVFITHMTSLPLVRVLEAKDNKSNTPLHLAAENGNHRVASVLLDAKALIESQAQHGLTPLHFAVKKGHYLVVKVLIERKANLDTRSAIGATALSMAAEGGLARIVKILLMHGADFRCKDILQRSALDVAMESKSELVTALLLAADPCAAAAAALPQRVPFNLSSSVARAQFQTPKRALIREACFGNGDVVEQLLMAKANPNEPFLGYTPLHCAVWSKSVETTDLLLAYGAELKSLRHSNGTCETVLSLALTLPLPLSHKEGNRICALVSSLIRGKADPNAPLIWGGRRGSWGGGTPHFRQGDTKLPSSIPPRFERKGVESSALIRVCKAGGSVALDLARVLLQSNARVNARDAEGFTAIMHAALSGSARTCELLLKNRADPLLEEKGAAARGALLMAAMSGAEGVIRVILKEKPSCVNYGNSHGHTPLIAACGGGHLGVARMLLNFNARVNAKGLAKGNTSLMVAALRGHSSVVRMLLRNQADPNSRSNRGETALSLAAFSGHVDIIKSLCVHRADVNVRGHVDNHSALSLACQQGRVAVVKKLLYHKALPSISEREAALKHGKLGVLALLDSALSGNPATPLH